MSAWHWYDGIPFKAWVGGQSQSVFNFDFAQAIANARARERGVRQTVRRDGLVWVVADVMEPRAVAS